MNSFLRRAGTALIALGFDPRRTLSSLRFSFGYVVDLVRWIRLSDPQRRDYLPLRLLPVLSDKYLASGVASGHYFHQDLWAARWIHRLNPRRHIDVGSRIDGFVSHLLSFREVEVVDIRPLRTTVKGLTFIQADLMSGRLPDLQKSDSVSCLHALEHFGLGRYGDPIQPDGWRVGLGNLASLVTPEGHLYLSVPIGQPAVEFNAQRIFRPTHIIDEAHLHGLVLKAFSFVDDSGDFHENVNASDPSFHACDYLRYGCGCFLFSRIQPESPARAAAPLAP